MEFTSGNVKEFDEFIKSLNLKHFDPYEVRVHCEHPKNGLPPKKYWKNIASTLWMLDVMREEFGSAIHLNSVYRSPAYNRSIPGAAKNSNHKYFCACDCSFFKLKVDAKLRDRIDKVLRRGLKNGTIERAGRGYYAGRFIHIDTNHNNGERPKGVLATWNG